MMYPSSQSLFCCLCEDLPEHTKGGVAPALPSPGKPDISRIFCHPLPQVALAGTQIFWTTEVNNAFGRLEEGYENALKDYYKKQIGQLNSLICLLLGNLSKGDRQKVTI